MTPPVERGPWPWPLRVAFRAAFIYVALFTLPFLTGWIPGMSRWISAWDDAELAVAQFLWGHALGLEPFVVTQSSGSGDRAANWIVFGLHLACALAGAALWSALARRVTDHRKLARWLYLAVRVSLGLVLLSYGFAKVHYRQFPFPSEVRLDSSYGESSPMGLLWTFMGYSRAYNVFTGAAEVLGGTLLFFRRTTTLGALITIGVMSNVVMLNLCYDVPVKLFSMHYLALAIALASVDARRLVNVLVLNRPAPAADHEPLLARPVLNRGLYAGVVLLLGGTLFDSIRSSAPAASAAPEWLRGKWSVTRFESDAGSPWTQLDVSRKARLVMSSGEPQWLWLRAADGGALSLWRDDVEAGRLTFTAAQDGGVLVEGTFDSLPVSASLSKIDAGSRLLMTRGFHWVSERPFNQ